MRSNCFKGSKLNRIVKACDRVMAIILAVFFAMVAITLLYSYAERKLLYPLKFKDIVICCAKENELESALVYSVIKVESGFNKRAKSSAGAVGLMQITPKTAEYIAKLTGEKEYDLFNVKTNVKFGCYYLRYLLKKFIVLDTAICAYNAGEGNVENWLKNKEYSDDGLTLKNIPFKETEEYRQKIHKTYKKYSELYENILDK